MVYKHLLGRHERIFTIDGIRIHIGARESKNIFDLGRSAIVIAVNDIKSCQQVKGTPIFTIRTNDVKHELEASSPLEANEICDVLNYILLKLKTEPTFLQ